MQTLGEGFVSAMLRDGENRHNFNVLRMYLLVNISKNPQRALVKSATVMLRPWTWESVCQTTYLSIAAANSVAV
jgi:hypothetical protein